MIMKKIKLNDITIGMIFLILSALAFTLMSVFVKLSGDLPSFQKAFFRNLISLIISLIFIIKYKCKPFGQKKNVKYLLIRAFFGTLGVIFTFYAIDNMALTDQTMIMKITPFLVIIFAAIFLKEKISLSSIMWMVMAFVGVIIVIRPDFSMETIPGFIALLGAISSAIAYTTLRYLGNKEDPKTVVFFFSLFSTIVLLPFLFFYYTPMSLVQIVYLLSAGVFSAIGQFCITYAYKYAKPSNISIFDYVGVIFAGILGFLIFGEIIKPINYLGYSLIFIASCAMFIENKEIYNLSLIKK